MLLAKAEKKISKKTGQNFEIAVRLKGKLSGLRRGS